MSVTRITYHPPGGEETDFDMDLVLFQTARFTMAVNGQPGEFYLQIKDLGHEYGFVVGTVVRLYIDEALRFGGFLMQATRTWPFPVLDTTFPQETVRTWNLTGTDWNVLWNRRIVYDAASLTTPYKFYPIGTYDNTILDDVLWNYSDVMEVIDDTAIDRVGIVILDIKANVAAGGGAPWNSGSLLREPFDACMRATGGIYYITSAGVLTYCDVDTATSTYALTDVPVSGGSSVEEITDSFDRVVVSGWGTGPIGSWAVSNGIGAASVDGSQGVIAWAEWDPEYNPGQYQCTLEEEVPLPGGFMDEVFTTSMTFTWPDATDVLYRQMFFSLLDSVDENISVYVGMDVSSSSVFAGWWDTVDSNENGDTVTFTGSGTCHLAFEYTKSSCLIRAKYWEGGAEPDWQVSITGPVDLPLGANPLLTIQPITSSATDPTAPFTVDSVNIATTSGGSGSYEEIGYRINRIEELGDQLCNDAMVWGAALGSDQIGFLRVEDQDSIDLHGRWQKGLYSGGLYRADSISTIANSMVYGTPSSKRGAKDNAVVFNCTVNGAPFDAGEKVRCVNAVFGFDTVLPLRKVTFTFPTPDDVVSELMLTYEIDTAWTIFEQKPTVYPKIKFPKPTKIELPPPPCTPMPCPSGECDEAICGITDTFTRTVASGWGTSDAGLVWDYDTDGETPPGAVSVSSGNARLSVPVGSDDGLYSWLNGTWDALPGDKSFSLTHRFRINEQDLTMVGTPWPYIEFQLGRVSWMLELGSASKLWVLTHGVTGGSWTPFILSTGVDYQVRFENEYNVVSRVKIWEVGTTEPGWIYSISAVGQLTPVGYSFDFQAEVHGRAIASSGLDISIWDLDISGVNRCSEYRFDNFNRSVAAGWGTSDTGYAWVWQQAPTTHGYPGVYTSGLDGGWPGYPTVGGLTNWPYPDATGGYMHTVEGAGGPWTNDEWTMEVRFAWEVYPREVVLAVITGGSALGVQVGGDHIHVSSVVDGANASYDFAFAKDTSYRVKVHYKKDTILEAKVWSGETEPANYQCYGIPDHSTSASSYLYVSFPTHQVGDTENTFEIDYIDFDYDGKPCYCGITDTFNRPDQVGLGTSDAAIEWTDVWGNGQIIGNEGWLITQTGIGDETNADAHLALSLALPLDVTVDVAPVDNGYGQAAFTFTTSAGNYYVWIPGPLDFGGPTLTVLFVENGPPYSTAQDSVSTTTTYDVMSALHVTFDGTTFSATYNGATASATVPLDDGPVLTVGFTFSAGTAVLAIAHFDNLDISGVGGCVDPEPAVSGSVPSVDPISHEVFCRGSFYYTAASALEMTLPTAYVLGSTRVNVSGIQYYLGVNYTESDENGDLPTRNGGQITFDHSPWSAPTGGGYFTVTVTYIQNGPFSGSAAWP